MQSCFRAARLSVSMPPAGCRVTFAREGGGFAVGPARVPIVPGAILFDLLNGGDKDWGRHSPYRDLAYEAASAAADAICIGRGWRGFGATVAAGAGLRMRGGLGSASARVALPGEGTQAVTVGALAAVNAAGAVTIADTPHFWAAPFEKGREFGGLGSPSPWPANAGEPSTQIRHARRKHDPLRCRHRCRAYAGAMPHGWR